MPQLNDKLQSLRSQLLDGDIATNFAQHRVQLNALEETDQIALATELVLDEHGSDINNYIVESLRHNFEPNIFYNTLSQAVALREKIYGLEDTRNAHAAEHFLSEISEDSLMKFSELSCILLDHRTPQIAMRCILTASDAKERQDVVKRARQISISYGKTSTFYNACQSAALTAHLCERLQTNPRDFFDSEELNPGLIHENATLCAALLTENKIPAIAAKICQLDPDVIASIGKKLEQLSGLPDSHDPFKQLHQAIQTQKSAYFDAGSNAHVDAEEHDSESQPLQETPVSAASVATFASMFAPEDRQEKASNDHSSCCRLL